MDRLLSGQLADQVGGTLWIQHIRLIKSPEKQFRTVAANTHIPHIYVLTVMDSDWSSCLLKISARVAISGFLVSVFFSVKKYDSAELKMQESNIFSIQFNISIKEPEFPATCCRQLLRRGGSSSPAPLSEILFSHLLKHSFIHFSSRR